MGAGASLDLRNSPRIYWFIDKNSLPFVSLFVTLKLANVRLAELETWKVLRFRYFIEALTTSLLYLLGILAYYSVTISVSIIFRDVTR